MGVLIYNHSQKESQNQLQVIVLIIFEATVKLTEYSNNVTGPLLSGIFYSPYTLVDIWNHLKNYVLCLF